MTRPLLIEIDLRALLHTCDRSTPERRRLKYCKCNQSTYCFCGIARCVRTPLPQLQCCSQARNLFSKAQCVASSTLCQRRGGRRCHVAVLFSGPCPLFVCSALAIFRASAVSRRLSVVFCVLARRSALSTREDFGETCLGPQPTHVQPAWLWRRLPSKAAQTCETCGTWPELILKLVSICVKVVKLGRGKPLLNFLPSFTSFTSFTQTPTSFRTRSGQASQVSHVWHVLEGEP